MSEPTPSSPSFGDLLKQGQAFLQGLQTFEAGVATELADRHAELGQFREQIRALELETARLQESQRLWSVERDRTLAEIAAGQKAMTELTARVADERRQVDAEHAEIVARQEDQRAELQQRLDAREASLEQARAAAEVLQAQVEELQAAHLGWAADRQRLKDEHDGLRQSTDAELARLKSELAAARADLETLQTYQLEWAAEREEQLRASKETQDLIAQATRQTTDGSVKRQALVTEIQQLNQELTTALTALARSQERERQREKVADELKRTWQQEKAQFDAQLRTALKTGEAAAISPERLHALSSDLNAVTGFSELLAQEAANKITPDERQEFNRLIKESAARLVEHIRALAPASAKLEPVAAAAGQGMPVILLADPDAATRERVQPFLERAGYEVLVAVNAAEAMEKALARQPLAVLVDATLPPNGGAALLRDLKSEPRTRDLPTVLAGEERPAGTPDANTEFLLKPIDRQRLLQVMVKLDLMADSQRARKMPGTVLLIDDDPQHVRLLKAMFKPFAIKLLTAETAEEGVELAVSQRPDLIILDLMLPNGDGFSVVDTVSRTPEVARTPIIVLTARGLGSKDAARLQGRVQTVLAKGDFNRERLLELILRRGERRGRGKAAA